VTTPVVFQYQRALDEFRREGREPPLLKRMSELISLLDLTTTLGSTLSGAEILDAALLIVMGELQVSRGALYVSEGEGRYARRASRGLAPQAPEVLERAHVEAGPFAPDPTDATLAGFALVCPVRKADRPIALLCLGPRAAGRPYGPDEAGFLESLAACADLLSQSAARFSSAEPLSALAHAMGEIALLEGNAESAVQKFEHAIALLEELQLPRERAESELRAAAACEALGRADAASRHAREAARRAERLGARPLEQAAAEHLRRLGERLSEVLGPRAGRRNEQAGLTARQLEILAAISRGLTDKEVARFLSLSPRTVESHVAKALATLGCRSRSAAVRRATELGLLGRTVAGT